MQASRLRYDCIAMAMTYLSFPMQPPYSQGLPGSMMVPSPRLRTRAKQAGMILPRNVLTFLSKTPYAAPAIY